MFRALLCSKHVQDYNKLVIKQEFVHYVGQLLRLSEMCYVTHHFVIIQCSVLLNAGYVWWCDHGHLPCFFQVHLKWVLVVERRMLQTNGRVNDCTNKLKENFEARLTVAVPSSRAARRCPTTAVKTS